MMHGPLNVKLEYTLYHTYASCNITYLDVHVRSLYITFLQHDNIELFVLHITNV